jgi:ABC-type polysaccharide/polyol phosphate transport system ATPase subunit
MAARRTRGANGADKSTLLRVIAGEESPDAGRISLLARTRFAYLPDGGVRDRFDAVRAARRYALEHRIEVVMHGLGLAAAKKRECSGRH